MTQYNTLNVTFSNSQLSKLKSGIKNVKYMLLVILMIEIIFHKAFEAS